MREWRQPRSVHWCALRWLALEHLQLDQRGAAVRADSVIVGEYDGTPIRLRYGIVCDEHWNTKSLDVEEIAADGTKLVLERSDTGGWRDIEGRPLAELTDAIDVDIAATPFTNTLPIRRLQLEPGESHDLDVLYVDVFPTVATSCVRQRYTCLDRNPSGARYLYESLASGFTAELTVDADDLVIDYPGVWERVPAGGRLLSSQRGVPS